MKLQFRGFSVADRFGLLFFVTAGKRKCTNFSKVALGQLPVLPCGLAPTAALEAEGNVVFSHRQHSYNDFSHRSGLLPRPNISAVLVAFQFRRPV